VRYTQAPQRRAELLRRVGEAGYLSCTAAARALGVSEMTIRRDLHALAGQGLLNRVAGGASTGPAARPFDQRRTAATAEKDAVARAAVALIAGEAVVALDAGTTVAALAGWLPGGLTVVTHSLPVILACAGREELELISLGGEYHAPTRSFAGPLAGAGLAQLAVDVAVLSATAAGPRGVYSATSWDAETKRAMAAIARRVVLLLDHRKLAARAPIRIMALDSVDAVVIDEGASETQLAMLRERCPNVVVAELAR
jgi:DeoR/GlpR family transcriptional regulator of sugar metabolism